MSLGLYVSRCGGRVDTVVDIDAALGAAGALADVVRVFDDLSDASAQEVVVSDIAERQLDAVVLAGHSVEHYTRSLSGQYLKQRIADAGVNPNRIVAANLLEQVALAHPDDASGATLKAAALLRVACSRAIEAPYIEQIETEPIRSVLILGATTEGAVAAQRLLQLGYSVVIADRADGLARLRASAELGATVAYVTGHPACRLISDVRMVDGEGWLGDYSVTLESASGPSTVQVGGILLARPDETAWVEELRTHFKVDVDDQGSARSLDPHTHPAETVDAGIMVVPLRDESAKIANKVSGADSAAMALVLRLSQPRTVHLVDVSRVDEDLCGGCASCVKTCAFGACTIGEDGFSHVDVRRCRGCGKCVVSCPVGARDIINSPHDYLVGAIRTLAEVELPGEEKVIGFLCGGCGYPAADGAARHIGEGGETYPATFLPVRIPCGGRLDTLYVLEAFKAGFDGVTVFRCREGHCHNLVGNLDMDRRINLLRTVLRSRRLDDARLRIIDISPFEGERFVSQVNDVFAALRTLVNGKGGPQ